MDVDSPAQGQVLYQPIAPRWHTLVVVLAMLTLCLLGTRPPRYTHIGPFRGHIPGYLVGMLVEWFLLAFVWYGLRLRGVKLRDLVGGKATFRGTLNDFGIAVVFLIGAGIVLRSLFSMIAIPNPGLRLILPRGRTEILVFLVLALTAGICEEIICRGYLQRQFTALTKNALGGALIQAVIFGVAHSYQGTKAMLAITVYGYLLGLLAHWRRSLRPGMMAHTLQDSLVGLLAGYVLK
ncbi:MAG: CPBP family intramembrane metalloprotease [Acidobacteria bacterium]|nr:CPBP family intramembrane metalloprotease [Acidobacteriota bacterium]